jgi:Helix-turn-helix of DDE superfamily endonuclease
VIAYRAMVDVPKELMAYLARLLADERRAIGTRPETRKLTCARQALMVLVWFRKNEDIALLAAGFGVSRATGYRYIAEGRAVLAAQAPDLHEALQQVAESGWAYVVLDGSLIGTDRCAQTTTSVEGETIDAWYSDKHRRPGGNIQAFMRPRRPADLGLRRRGVRVARQS